MHRFPRDDPHRPRFTQRRDFRLPDTGCECVPWVICEHHPLYPATQELIRKHYGLTPIVEPNLFDVLFPDDPLWTGDTFKE
jgi:hypothetical protein